ncbi:MAG TPA: universal stress protein, partial [Polyangiaceae bacterium]
GSVPYVDPMIEETRNAARQRLEELIKRVRGSHPNLAVSGSFRDGDAGKEILAAASEGEADLIVVGTHGETGVWRLLLGSVAEYVVRHSAVPVLSVHGARTST